MHVPLSYADDVNYTRRPGRWNTGVSFLAPPEGSVPGATPLERRAALAAMNKGMLVAWDPVAQKARWWIEHAVAVERRHAGHRRQPRVPGRSLRHVPRPRRRHRQRAVELRRAARDRWPGRSPIASNGEQYVAVLAGYGGSMGMATQTDWMRRPPPNGAVLVFKLGGTAQLKKLPPLEPAPYVTQRRALHARAAGRRRGAVLHLLHDLPQRPDQPRT